MYPRTHHQSLTCPSTLTSCLLVNIGILPYATEPLIREFSELGIILIMFSLDFEES
jgi:hypothetical protein